MATYSAPPSVEELATRARQLAAIGQLEAARHHWVAVLSMLPSDSAQHRAVQNEIDKLDARLNPSARPNWKKRLGPLGVIIAALAKFKSGVWILLTKGKFLIGILSFVGLYWSLFGWWFGIGLTASVLLHEFGHYFTVRRYGFKAELPMLIPIFGAFVAWRGGNVEPAVRARISLAGPLFGFFSGVLFYGVYLQTHYGVWLALAQFAGWLNLLNLIPVSIFDGASAMTAVGVQGRFAILLVSLALAFVFHEWVFVFIAAATAVRLFRRESVPQPSEGIAYYFLFLLIANGFLSWYARNQAHLLFLHRA